MRIMVAGLVHDRPTWPLWLRHLDALDAGGHELIRLHLVDAVGFGREQDTGDLSWCPVPPPRLVAFEPGQVYQRHDRRGTQDGGPDDPRRKSLPRMAALRNRMVRTALEANVDALVNIDSDIMAPSDLVLRLAEGGYSWIAAVVGNDVTNARNCNIIALLTDRLYGKVTQPISGEGGGPVKVSISIQVPTEQCKGLVEQIVGGAKTSANHGN